MGKQHLNRRQWLLAGASASAIAAPASSVARVGNGAVEFRQSFEDGRLVKREFVQKLAREIIELPAEEFAFEFIDGSKTTSADLRASVVESVPQLLRVRYSGAEIEVEVRYTAPPDKHYVRKQVLMRHAAGRELRLIRATLENWRGVARDWQTIRKDRYPYGSHPVFCDNVWAGVEFVAAFNEVANSGFALVSRPGGKRVGPDWIELHSTVVGAAAPGRAREAFLDYIEDIRLTPPRMLACYNTWWTLTSADKQPEATIALVRTFKEKLFDAHGVFFDLVATDAGWSDQHAIWQIDRKKLPHGFRDVRALVESAGGKLGLWISPSEVYPNDFDYAWAEANGYRIVRPAREARDKGGLGLAGVSLADPRYREQTIRQIERLVREEGLAHIKYDGFLSEEDIPHDGLLAGPDSVEPLADYSLELLRAAKRANPALVTEPTYLNTFVCYISPWMIRESDTLWASAGGDSPRGMLPAPDYREAATSSRDYFVFYSLDEVWLPQNALQYFDIVHCNPSGGFPNHVAMAVGRGHFFLATYMNPRYLGEDDYRAYAGLLKYARANQEILRRTTIVASRVELGEPYAYAHWFGDRGILAVRNPSNETRNYRLELSRAGAPATLSGAVCYTQFPYRRGIADKLSASSAIELKLAPWETLILEIRPRQALGEPVAMDARWFRRSDGKMGIVPAPGIAKVRILAPDGVEHAIDTTPRAPIELRGKATAQSTRTAPESEWLKPWFRPRNMSDPDWSRLSQIAAPTIFFEQECVVEIPTDVSNATVLLLVAFPGRRFHPSRAEATVNGKPAKLEPRHSAGHIGYNIPRTYSAYAQVLPHENEWTWYLCDVPAGTSRIRFHGAAADPSARFGLWLWAERDIAHAEMAAGAGCGEPALPPHGERIERAGILLRRPVSGE
jgi:hypothetical protein